MNTDSRTDHKHSWVTSPRTHLILYSLLLVATPFIMLQNYLQDAIGRLSHSQFTISGVTLPYIPVIGAGILVVIVAANVKRINRWHMIAAVAVVLMVIAAQNVADIYFDHDFYELQQNWHYIAYGIFVWFMYQDQKQRNVPISKLYLRTFGLAVGYSSFDEFFQYHMSNRIFDISDVAKDSWGCLIGLVILTLTCLELRKQVFASVKIRHPVIADYFSTPFTVLFHLVLLGYTFLTVSSLLTEIQYLERAILTSILCYGILFIAIHLTAYRFIRKPLYILYVSALVIILVIGFQNRKIPLNQKPGSYVTCYGIPVPVFDCLMVSNGTFRLVDKKTWFNKRDQRFLLKIKSDVLIIGTGRTGRGGLGLPSAETTFFVYNGFTHKGTQIIRLPTIQAIKTFNRLKKDGKNVAIVVHQETS